MANARFKYVGDRLHDSDLCRTVHDHVELLNEQAAEIDSLEDEIAENESDLADARHKAEESADTLARLTSALAELVNFPSPESRQRAVDLLTELDIPVYA